MSKRSKRSSNRAMSQSRQFRNDIEELAKSGAKISADAFRAICRGVPPGEQGLEDLGWANEYIYDFWNFERGDNHFRHFMNVLEEQYEMRKIALERGGTGSGGDVTIQAGTGGASGHGGPATLGGNGSVKRLADRIKRRRGEVKSR